MKVRWRRFLHPTPAPSAFGTGKVLPEQNASWLSRLTLHWLSPFLDVGFSRPLEKEDLWELPQARHSETLADNLEKNYYSCCPPEKRPLFMRESSRSITSVEKQEDHKETKTAPRIDADYDESLFNALYQSFKPRILSSGLLLLFSDTLRTTLPLVNKVFLTWLTDSFVYARLTDAERTQAASEGVTKPRGVGYGIGLAIAIYVMQESASIMTNHFTLIGMTTGLYARSSVIGMVFRKSLRLSGRSRAEHSVGKITTLISSDITRVDTLSYLGHYLWDAPIQIAICIGLLIGTIGVSALAGLAVLFAAIPVQFILVTIMISQRQKCVNITDKRVRLTSEVLQGIRLIKAYGWERFYAQKITGLRKQEVSHIKTSSVAAALLIATFYFTPVFASILAFITYSLTGHELSVATIFTALQLFNVLRAPLLLLPLVLSGLADAMVSFGRLTKFLTAEELSETYLIDKSQAAALYLEGDFEWETVRKLEETPEEPLSQAQELENLKKEAKRKKEEQKRLKAAKKGKVTDLSEKEDISQNVLPSHTKDGLPVETEEAAMEKPFALKNLHMQIQKGAFIAIVGPVGSGKSSILQAMIGEMRCSRGKVIFNDRLAYVPQSPWIKNATVEENILFGQEYDEKRFQDVIQACSLEHDLGVFTHGQHTEIGEKGINLSGGQKARVSLARAAYSQSEIVLLDDPFAAVDAHVGKRILEDCILHGPLSHRTRILVTHALHILDKADYIYVIDNGNIVEEGSYKDLIARKTVLAHLIDEHGKEGSEKKKTVNQSSNDAVNIQGKSGFASAALMQEEERNIGAVTWDVYAKYFKSAGGLFWAPVIAILLLLVEGNNTFTTLFLGFWSGDMLHHFSQGDYMGVYGALGVAFSISTFILTYVFVIVGLSASLNLYRSALSGVLHSRISFFDTTPIGRIQSRLSKDQDTIDSVLAQTLMHVLTTFFSVVGTIGLVFYAFPYLGIIFLPLGILYYGAAVYYRRSSVEAKRLDSLNRSMLYASYTETLTGLSSMRAYAMQKRAVSDAEHGLDMENRAYLMTVVMQRWLALRLEFFANFLVLGIGLFGAGLRTHVNPAKIGVVLSYTLSATAVFSELISLFATSEQNMNAVERVLHYVELPEEGNKSKTIEPSCDWPSAGEISFRNIKLAYREGLPFVLKGISFDIKAGEKIGIVGRTGSGKSSIIQALLRLVEIQDGQIMIDNLDISTVGFNTLRTRLAFVPQDTTFFLGTLRDNLDPEKLRTDAELITILQQAWLLPKDGKVDPGVEAKFSLDSSVGDEGSNYSAGEKQLLALCRALVKKSRIIILDEATSSVDVETDFKVQKTIQAEFADSTLVCIAHRLNTILHYDRILVMDDGKVAEFDSALRLFDRSDSLFRALCDEAQLTRGDILEHCTEAGSKAKD